MDKIAYDTRIYTDLQGLKRLQYEKDGVAAKKEVSQQFESLFMQMVFHSMRDANKALASDLFGGQQMEMYQDMFDKQLSLMLPKGGLGLAELIEKNIDQMQQIPPELAADHQVTTSPSVSSSQETPVEVASSQSKKFTTAGDFIKKLWSSAKLAAKAIGAPPELLLAQAALETNWGKSILPQGEKGSSHNLFNIKAGSNWSNKTTQVASLEQRNGILVKEKSDFRSYDSYDESFADYVHLLKENDRYKNALTKAENPRQFTEALQAAGYATDENYAQKIMKIYSSQSFKDLVADVKEIEPM